MSVNKNELNYIIDLLRRKSLFPVLLSENVTKKPHIAQCSIGQAFLVKSLNAN